MPLHGAGNKKSSISIFERVTDWLSQTGSSMYPALLEDQFDLFRDDQRARRIMNGIIPGSRIELTQAGPNGILTMCATGNDRLNFFEIFIANDGFDFSVSIFTRDQNNFIDTAGTLKCI